MKKLIKKSQKTLDTLEAYKSCSCNCRHYCDFGGAAVGISGSTSKIRSKKRSGYLVPEPLNIA